MKKIAFIIMIISSTANAQYASEKDIADKFTNSENQRKEDFYEYPIGKTFWIESGENVSMQLRIGFFRTIEVHHGVEINKQVTTSGYVFLNDKFFPKLTTSFVPLKYITAKNQEEQTGGAYLVKLEDGLEVYMERKNFGIILKNYGDTRSAHISNSVKDIGSNWQKLFTKSPDEILENHLAEKMAKAKEDEKAEALAIKKRELEEIEYKKKKPVRIGMTRDQVLMSRWGGPININTTTTSYGISEQWVYKNSAYLYFKNGKLTAIQN